MLLHIIDVIAKPWGELYNDSKLLQSGVTFLHFAALLFAGGFAVASDRWVLRARRAAASNQTVVLEELSQIHRPVVIGIALLVATGGLMALADADTMLVSPVFWIKMSCFALLLLNGLVLKTAETRLRKGIVLDSFDNQKLWRRLGTSARRSMFLWAATLLLGVLLGNAS